MLPSHEVVHVEQAQRPGCLSHATIERIADDVVHDRQDDTTPEAAHIRKCTECLGDLLLEVLAKGIEYAEIKYG